MVAKGRAYLIGLVGSSSGGLPLLTRGELGEVSVIITLPVEIVSSKLLLLCVLVCLHLVVKDLGLSRLRLWDEGAVQNIEDILADFLKLGLDLLAVIADSADVLVGALGLFLLLD